LYASVGRDNQGAERRLRFPVALRLVRLFDLFLLASLRYLLAKYTVSLSNRPVRTAR
jgi:hypothetical protein